MSAATFRIPTPLREFTKGADEVRVHGKTVRDALADLGKRCPGLVERILGPDKEPRPFVNVFVGSRNVRTIGGLDAAIADGEVLSIIPAVAGGDR